MMSEILGGVPSSLRFKGASRGGYLLCTPNLGHPEQRRYVVQERSASKANSRRSYASEFKTQVVLEVLSGVKSPDSRVPII